MKKKKQIKELKRVFNESVRRNFDLLSENANMNRDVEEYERMYLDLSAKSKKHAEIIATLENELKKSNARITEIAKENAHLRTENDLARMQLLDAQEKMRKPVFVPAK